jgi:hypothetical protein
MSEECNKNTMLVTSVSSMVTCAVISYYYYIRINREVLVIIHIEAIMKLLAALVLLVTIATVCAR